MRSTVRSGSAPTREERSRHSPVRTCVGCRGRDEQPVLLRAVARWDDTASTWRIVLEERRRGHGRGAYVHPDPQCLQSAIRRRGFSSALRLPAGSAVDLTEVEARLAQQDT